MGDGLGGRVVMGLRVAGLHSFACGLALHPSYDRGMGVARQALKKKQTAAALTHHGPRALINHVPAIAICSIKIEPVVFVPREMVSAPTATICWNMSARLPAMVISWTACWILPFSTQ